MSSLEERYKKLGLRTTSILDIRDDPKYYKQKKDGVIVEKSTPAQEYGTRVHLYLLEYDEFKKTYVTLNYTRPRGDNQNNFCEYIAKQIKKDSKTNKKDLCIEAYKRSYKTGSKSDKKITEEAIKLYEDLTDYIEYLVISTGDKEVISFNALNKLKENEQIVRNHKKASKLIFEDILSSEKHYNETFVLWEFPDPNVTVNGEPLVIKSTIDKLIVDHDNKVIKLVDLKTSNSLSEFTDKFKKYDNYKVQLACYWFAVETFLRREHKNINFDDYSRETYLVALQSPNLYREYPLNCRVWPISQKTLSEGVDIIKELLPDVAWHFENDLWDHKRSYYEGDGAEKAL